MATRTRSANGRGSGAASDAHIGATTRVRGRIAGEGDLTVEGQVDGTVSIRGALTVTEGGAVAADTIEADAITVGGVLEGEMRVSGQVRALAGARVRGNVQGGGIAIDDGAEFAGRIDCEFELPPELEGSERGGRAARR